VAGGRGQSLIAIKGEIEGSGKEELGRWILQERKAVLDSIPDSELPGIEKMAIDFLIHNQSRVSSFSRLLYFADTSHRRTYLPSSSYTS
jgi:hypothetical protein